MARRIVNKTNCPIMSRDNDESKWWSVLYVGKAAKKDEEGSYVWKLRDELAEALGRVDLSKVNLYANLEPNFWKISHGNDCISDVEAAAFEKRQVIVVHKDTAAKGKSKVSQGEDFMATMKKGDFFYLCRGNSIRLLGRIESDEVMKIQKSRMAGMREVIRLLRSLVIQVPILVIKSGGRQTRTRLVLLFPKVKHSSLKTIS